jgi:hypothetical protein
MPTKTDRILSYLPRTFSAFPRPTALYSVADAFGSELLKAENSLAALMLAHWVDQADKGAEFISDLACIAALYSLAPRGTQDQSQTDQGDQTSGNQAKCPPLIDSEESVEEFRDHLKRYVRTFIDGTVTVQGILRITAEALGLHIADDYTQMDTWWTRPSDAFTSVVARGEDAAHLLFGVDAAAVSGQPLSSASITGTKNLSGGVDLRGASIMRISVDGAAAVDVDCAQDAGNHAAVQLNEIKNAISTKLGSLIVSDDGQFLTLTSPIVGATSRLEVQEVSGDAAELLLGLLPRTYHGSVATSARVTGTVDLQNGVDLSTNRYLRLQVDGNHLAEIDCAGNVANKTTLDEITKAIYNALGISVASPTPDGRFLTLTSPTTGFRSSIAFLPAAAQDGKVALFGSPPSFTTGVDALAARIIGTNDLSKGVDLSTRSHVRILVDAHPPITVACAGANPAQTFPAEIVSALNAALGSSPPIATQDGRFIRLTSPTTGPNSVLVLEALPGDEDGTALIFGIGPRVFHGTAATRARLVGTPDLSAGADLRARHVVQVAVDSGTPIEVNLWSHAGNLSAVPLDKLVTMFDDALGPGIATQDDSHLTLVSPTSGGASRIELDPLETISNQRFVTSAFISDEAAFTIFGFFTRHAQGIAATSARVVGTADLSRGVDLREQHFLRIGIDGQTPSEVNFAAKSDFRLRAAALNDIVDYINNTIGHSIAASDGKHLVLTSPTLGSRSKVVFEPSRSADALDTLLGLEPGVFHGSDATRVSFVGTVDLSPGVDLSATSKIKLGVDKVAAKEIDCVGANPAKTTLQEIVNAINTAFVEIGGVVANQDGIHIILTSPTNGNDSKIDFEVPSASDATKTIFGIAAPRTYKGSGASPATITGNRDLSGGVDLRIAHHLIIAVDGKTAVDVNFATNITDLTNVKLPVIVQEINKQLPNVASPSDDGTHLILSSLNSGAGAQIALQRYTGGDAHNILLGADVPMVTTGENPAPAVITGDADLLAPVNLGERPILRLAVDGQRPRDMDVSGAEPEKSSLDEIVAKINSVIPGLASATENDRLRLTSPTAGEESQLDLFPLRTLNLIEYPPTQVDEPSRSVRPGDKWFEINDGAADADLCIDLSAPQGAESPSLVNLDAGLRLRLLITIRSDEVVRIRPDAQTGVTATIIDADGKQSLVPGTKILVGPLGGQSSVPFDGKWALSGGEGYISSTIELNNPLAPVIVALSARQPGHPGDTVTVSVTGAKLPQREPITVTTDGQLGRVIGWLSADAKGYRLGNAPGEPDVTIVRLLAGRDISLAAHLDRAVVAYGPLHHGEDGLLMVVTHISDLFDLEVEGKTINENYPCVSIGTGSGPDFPEDITWRIITKPSRLVRAIEMKKGTILTLPRGRTTWIYLDGDGDRFDAAAFKKAQFANGIGKELAVFDISRFSPAPPEQEATMFAGPISGVPVKLQFHWTRRQPGAFMVNLPDDLPDRFGSRFNQVRFGTAKGAGEGYEHVVTEPTSDADYIGTILADSKLVDVNTVSTVPLGWDPVPIPFHHPRSFNLSGGTDSTPAQLYLQEEGVPAFIELSAKESGVWGNDISVRVSRNNTSPAHYDVTISYQGVRLENARHTVSGGRYTVMGGEQLSPSGDDLLKPGPVGILQSKAAGIKADVTRDRTYSSEACAASARQTNPKEALP